MTYGCTFLYMLLDEMLQALVHEMCDETEVAVLQLKASLSAISFNFIIIIICKLSLRLLQRRVHFTQPTIWG